MRGISGTAREPLSIRAHKCMAIRAPAPIRPRAMDRAPHGSLRLAARPRHARLTRETGALPAALIAQRPKPSDQRSDKGEAAPPASTAIRRHCRHEERPILEVRRRVPTPATFCSISSTFLPVSRVPLPCTGSFLDLGIWPKHECDLGDHRGSDSSETARERGTWHHVGESRVQERFDFGFLCLFAATCCPASPPSSCHRRSCSPLSPSPLQLPDRRPTWPLLESDRRRINLSPISIRPLTAID